MQVPNLGGPVQRVRIAIAGFVAVAALVAPPGRSPSRADAEVGPVTVSPNAALKDFQPVEVSVTGWEPGIYEWFECRGGAVDESDCDAYNADFFYVGADGTGSDQVFVDARIWLPDGTPVDCRTDPAGCEIGVGYLVDADQWPEVHLDFDATAPLREPVSARAEPSTDLSDDQVIQLFGQHLSFHEEAWAYLCRTGPEVVGKRCDLQRQVSTVPKADGTATLELKVRAAFDPPLGGHVDCRRAGTSCVAIVAWSYYPPPDRRAEVPLSFGEAPTTSTSSSSTSTSSPSTSTTSTTVPPPPPPVPVSGQPSFTG
jgi:hypothetical protein